MFVHRVRAVGKHKYQYAANLQFSYLHLFIHLSLYLLSIFTRVYHRPTKMVRILKNPSNPKKKTVNEFLAKQNLS